MRSKRCRSSLQVAETWDWAIENTIRKLAYGTLGGALAAMILFRESHTSPCLTPLHPIPTRNPHPLSFSLSTPQAMGHYVCPLWSIWLTFAFVLVSRGWPRAPNLVHGRAPYPSRTPVPLSLPPLPHDSPSADLHQPPPPPPRMH